MGRTSRRGSEDYSSVKKRSRRRSSSSSSSSRRRSPVDKCKPLDSLNRIDHKKRDDKREDKRDSGRHHSKRDRSPEGRGRSKSASPVAAVKSRSPAKDGSHVMTRRMSQCHKDLNTESTVKEGDFSRFPEITQKTRESLIARGITHLFPV